MRKIGDKIVYNTIEEIIDPCIQHWCSGMCNAHLQK